MEEKKKEEPYMVHFDKNKQEALWKALQASGSQVRLAKKANISRQLINKYLNNKVKSMTWESWVKLRPFLYEYLIDSQSELPPELRETIPMISLETAAGFDSTVESFDRYALSNPHSQTITPFLPRDLVAIQLSSYESWYTPGTIIYVNFREYPDNNKRVLAKLKSNGTLQFFLFFRSGNQFKLISSKRTYLWKSAEENPFAWILPIKYSLRVE